MARCSGKPVGRLRAAEVAAALTAVQRAAGARAQGRARLATDGLGETHRRIERGVTRTGL